MKHPMRRIQNIHFVGIGGSGMGGIAEVMHNLGYKVSGSDLHKNSITKRLHDLGIKITYSHIADNVAETDVVVYSSAVNKNNIEISTAKIRRIPVVPRAEMLAELMRFKYGIAVAGSHGKTTVTSMVASLFAESKLDPTFVVGGKINQVGSNSKLGKGKYFIAEADESDTSFLHLSPMLTVVTNIDEDHLESYNNDFNALKQTFIEFVHRLPFYGCVVLCIDDPSINQILPDIMRPYVTYGLSDSADVRAKIIDSNQNGYKITVKNPWVADFEVLVPLPGEHNIVNALAAITVALEMEIAVCDIKQGILNFKGVGRRIEDVGDYPCKNTGTFKFIDDYGHHPTEINCVVKAIKQRWPQRRIVMVFQPHRYSRTASLFASFVETLATVDKLLVLPIYAASEDAIDGVDSEALNKAINAKVVGLSEHVTEEELFDKLTTTLQDRDILITQGAGSIGKICVHLQDEFLLKFQEHNVVV